MSPTWRLGLARSALVLGSAAACSERAPNSTTVPIAGSCREGARAADGTCAGVPPDGCAPGFTFDDAEGCRAVQPSSACAAGEVAWLGETVCHAITPCREDRWGDIPTDDTTLFVDAAYVGNDGN